MNLFATQRLVELISNIDHQIASTLQESIRYRNSFPVSYLDFGSTNDTISFIARNKYDDIQKNNRSDWNSKVWKDKRSEMKIGKLVRMFYNDHFPTNHPKGQPRPKPLMDIESFVNKFKAERDKDVNYERFEIITGKDFHTWYSQDNYSRFVHEETTLGRSCLRYNESSKFLHMFSKNPDTFRMLILKDDANKLRGRANLYTLVEPEGRIYMDRVYSVNDFDVELFKDFAKQEGWLHKEAQTYGWHNNIVDTKTGKIHKWDDMVMKSTLNKIPGDGFKYYPYLDTMSILNTEEKTLTNDGRLRVLKPHFVLSDYQGSYVNEVDGHERVFSTIYNEYIRRDESVFVEIDDAWVYEHETVYVHNSGGLSAHRNSDKIVESYIYKRKWFLKEAAEFSEYLGTYVHKESIRIAFLDETKSEEVKIHYRMVGKEFFEKDGVILKKKDNTNQKLSSKLSRNQYEALEQAIGRISGDYSSPNRTGDTWLDDTHLRYGHPLPRFEEPQSEPSNEEDSDLLNGVNLDSFNPELRESILRILEERRLDRNRRRSSNRIRFSDTQMNYGDLLQGNPMRVEQPTVRTPRVEPTTVRTPRVEPMIEREEPRNDREDVVDDREAPGTRLYDIESDDYITLRSDLWGDYTNGGVVNDERDEPVTNDERDEPVTNDESVDGPQVTDLPTNGLFYDSNIDPWNRVTTGRRSGRSLDSNNFQRYVQMMYSGMGIPGRYLGVDPQDDTPDDIPDIES